MWFVLLSISRYKLVISCRSSTSPWSWRRPSGEPTTASRCPTSSATYPCREQELVRPRGQRFRAHLLQLRLKTRGLMAFSQKPMWLFKGHAHIALYISPSRQRNITSSSEDQLCIYELFLVFCAPPLSVSVLLTLSPALIGLHFNQRVPYVTPCIICTSL